jgi:hypothetical protein
MATKKKPKAAKAGKPAQAARGGTAKSAKSPKAAKAKGASKRGSARPGSEQVLSPEDLAKVLELSKGSTSVEIKLSVPAAGHRATVRSLKLDPVEAQPRQTFFFDTPDLDLYKAGVVVRARRIQGGRADTVVKLRPVDPGTIDPDLRRSGSFKIEVDVMPGGYVCSASLKGNCTGQEVLDVTAGLAQLSSLFSKEQRAFYDAHAPAGVKMDALAVLGPTFLLKSKHQPKNFDRPVTVEMWLYPDGSRILEISTKALPEESFQVAAEFKAYLASCGISLGSPQETKTKTALQFFSKTLASESATR